MFNLFDLKEIPQNEHDRHSLFEAVQIHLNLLDVKESVPLFLSNVEPAENGENHLGWLYTEYQCIYQDEDGNHRTKLNFQIFEDFLSVYVESELTAEKLFQNNPAFSAKDGIIITLPDPSESYSLMANYQHKDWWTRPFFSADICNLPVKTQSLLFKTEDTYHHVLPVVDGKFRTEISGDTNGLHFSVSAYQGGFRKISCLAFLSGKGKDPFQLAEANTERGTTLLGNSTSPRKNKKYPEILDYLGWCSWDAFYHEVNEQGLLKKAAEFEEIGVPVKWVMIDDGWSTTNENKLEAFHADQVKFPSGLANTVKQLKQKSGVKWVGVWHSIAGYWDGIHPESELAERFKENLYSSNNGSLLPYPSEKAFDFWNSWHKELLTDGIDFVKVDSQSAIPNFFRDQFPIGEAAGGVHTALEASCSLHFDNTIINSMGMAQENIWTRPSSAVSRNSDDFVPEILDSFREHALQNAYNSYYHGPFYWGDWDMYWSKNHDDQQNMVLRAISGGPIYISDEVGSTNPEMILPLVYQDGKIIRCDQPGLPTEDCLMRDPMNEPIPLKLWNRIGKAGVIAAFNINGENTVKGTISPGEISGSDGGNHIIFNCIKHEYSSLKLNEKRDLELSTGETALFMIIPEQEITPVGLINKLIPADSILETSVSSSKVTVRLKEGGRFAFISKKSVQKATVQDKPVSLENVDGQKHLYVIDCRDQSSPVDIDIF